jgi:hypothetical protein
MFMEYYYHEPCCANIISCSIIGFAYSDQLLGKRLEVMYNNVSFLLDEHIICHEDSGKSYLTRS